MQQTSQNLDLAAYLHRIDYHGRTPKPDYETLAQIHLHHPLAIPFENLDPLLGRPVPLDIGSLQEKLIFSRRGGYCFEHNILLWHVLRALGFRVSGLAARVLWGRPEDAVTPRTHMLLRVELPKGTYLADVGFGGLTSTGPLLLEANVEQRTPHELFRLEREGETWRVRALAGSEWRSLYRFGLEEHLEVDYELANYYLSTSRASHFVHTLIAARPTKDGRYALLNNRLTIRERDGSTTQRQLASADEVVAVLWEQFGIEVPDRAALAETLRREGITPN